MGANLVIRSPIWSTLVPSGVKAGIAFGVCAFIDVHNRENRNRGEERITSDIDRNTLVLYGDNTVYTSQVISCMHMVLVMVMGDDSPIILLPAAGPMRWMRVW
jgi:hypothetical protein